MKRNQFIKSIGLAVSGIAVIPQFSFTIFQEEFTINKLTGKGNKRLVGTNFQLMDTAYEAFQKMKKEALKSNIQLEVVSAYRSFERQKQIWNRKYKSFLTEGLTPIDAIYKITEYSTIPGTSRHHWGTDIDLIDAAIPAQKNVLQEKHFINNGVFCLMKEWMTEHANRFGFYEVYTNVSGRKGFKYEPWHFSYEPLSKPMLKAYQNLNMKSIIKNSDIQGSDYLTTSFIENYIKNHILDINPILLP